MVENWCNPQIMPYNYVFTLTVAESSVCAVCNRRVGCGNPDVSELWILCWQCSSLSTALRQTAGKQFSSPFFGEPLNYLWNHFKFKNDPLCMCHYVGLGETCCYIQDDIWPNVSSRITVQERHTQVNVICLWMADGCKWWTETGAVFDCVKVHDSSSTQTTHTHYFSLPPRFLIVNTSFAHIDAVIWPLPIPFEATAVKLEAFVLLGFHLCTYDERERVAELLRRHEASQVLWLLDFPAAVT